MSYEIKTISKRVADALYAQGITVSPKSNGFFEPIIEQMDAPLEGVEIVSTESLRTDINAVYKDKYGQNPFVKPSLEDGDIQIGDAIDIVNEAAFKELKPIVLGTIEILKNQVNPVVKSIYESCIEKVQDAINGAGIQLTIVTNGMELPVWSNPRVQHICTTQGEASANWLTVNQGVNFPEKTVEELAEIIRTGDDLFDTEVKQLLATQPADALVNSYNRTFNTSGSHDIADVCKCTYNLLSALLASRFIDEIVDGLDSIDLDQYTIMLRRICNSHGTELSNKLNQRGTLRNAGYYIVNYPEQRSEFTKGSKIVVDGLLHQRFLELGGEIDAIYGAYLSGDMSLRYIDPILDKNDSLCRDWFNHISYAQQSKRDDFQRLYSSHLRRAILEQAAVLGIGIKTDAFDKMFNRISSLTEDTVFTFSRRTIIHCLYPDTDYLSILENIDAVSEQHEGISFDGAIQMAIIDWLVGWALTHVKVKAVKVTQE